MIIYEYLILWLMFAQMPHLHDGYIIAFIASYSICSCNVDLGLRVLIQSRYLVYPTLKISAAIWHVRVLV